MSTIPASAYAFCPPRPRDTATALPRPVRVEWCLGLIYATGLADLILTLGEMTGAGMFEGNPIVAFLAIATNSAVAIALYKILLMTFGCGVLWRFRRRRIAEIGGLIVLTAYTVTLVLWVLYLQAMASVTLPDVDLPGFIRLG